ncbi:MAG: DUF4954 family protein [Bacteroidales bacterium]|nr:DUF4954 family protein [Bacteroidales bacterium]
MNSCKDYRQLSPAEVDQWKSNGNTAQSWDTVLVSGDVQADIIRNNCFGGNICIDFGEAGNHGTLADGLLEVAVGIAGSRLVDCTIGPGCAIRDVKYLRGYTIGSGCLICNVDEMAAGGEPVWMEPMNENGGRRLLPVSGMRIGDAYLWARFRDHAALLQRLEAMSRKALNGAERYGVVGNAAVIKNCKELRNVRVDSTAEAPTRLYDCIALTDGVISPGCTLEYGIIAQRFLLGENVHLEYALRLNDSVVGDNSTLARCEVGNSIIFPAHEQHHNNSFLIAGLIQGQSNIAAGGTLGSNHNGRTADNELAAGRGFWPGLCVSVKHSSRFSSYCLLSKADYPHELNITLPFALVNNNVAKNQLEVMPAYWWLYNMYALNRNIKKFASRDRRKYKRQHVEFDPFAPDTAEELLVGRGLLKMWTEKAYAESKGSAHGDLGEGLAKTVAELPTLEVRGYGMECGKRKTVILKPGAGYRAYEEMLIYYAMRVLTEQYGDTMPPKELNEGEARVQWWINLGGQLLPKPDAMKLIADIESGLLDSWDAIHQRLDDLWQQYPMQKVRHAYQVLCELSQRKALDEHLWASYQVRFAQINQYVENQKIITRKKDDDNEFRHMTYWNSEEMQAVLG